MQMTVSSGWVAFTAVAVLVLGCLEEPERRVDSCEDEACNTISDENLPHYVGTFGTEVGEVIAPLDFGAPEGFAFGLQDIYQQSDTRLLLMTTSSGWCAACKEEQPTLASIHSEFRESGLEIMVVLFQKQDYSAADIRMAERWKDRYELDFPVVADPDFITQPYYPGGDASATPLVMIIDTSTMEILFKATGFREQTVRALVENRLGVP